jgi:hypothetical protein
MFQRFLVKVVKKFKTQELGNIFIALSCHFTDEKEDRASTIEMKSKALDIFNQLQEDFTQPDESSPEVESHGKLIPGDIVIRMGAFGCDDFEHYAIYIGGNSIIHVNGIPSNPNVTETGVKSIHTAFFKHPTPYENLTSGVVIQSWDEFIVGGSNKNAKIRVYHDIQRTESRRNSILSAIQIIGMWNYHLLYSNCEHFIRWCVSKEFRSEQIHTIIMQ